MIPICPSCLSPGDASPLVAELLMGRSLLRRLIQEEIRAAIDEMKPIDYMAGSHGIPVRMQTRTDPYPPDFDPFADDIIRNLARKIVQYLRPGRDYSISDIRHLAWDKDLYDGPRAKLWDAIDMALDLTDLKKSETIYRR